MRCIIVLRRIKKYLAKCMWYRSTHPRE